MGKPSVSDFAGVKNVTTMHPMARRPSPSFKVPETRRTNDDSIGDTNNCKRHCAARVPPSKRRCHIESGLGFTSRDGAPLVKSAIILRSGHYAVNMTMFQRLKANVPTIQYGDLHIG